MVANVDFACTFISDPGHGYLIVSRQQMQILGLKEDDFSAFSYKNNEIAPTQYALEEDCDYQVFWRRAQERGITLKVTEEYTDEEHAVRNWPSIHSIPF